MDPNPSYSEYRNHWAASRSCEFLKMNKCTLITHYWKLNSKSTTRPIRRLICTHMEHKHLVLSLWLLLSLSLMGFLLKLLVWQLKGIPTTLTGLGSWVRLLTFSLRSDGYLDILKASLPAQVIWNEKSKARVNENRFHFSLKLGVRTTVCFSPF